MLFKFLKHLGYKVRYVRNITDVGHLEHDADEGEDKIAKKARLEQLEPMEVVQSYTLRYHEAMRQLNVAPPSIEPRASGHIIEQIETVKKILDAGYAYISNGSVYFDVENTTRSSITASCPAELLRIHWRERETSTDRATNTLRMTLHCGKRLNLSIL